MDATFSDRPKRFLFLVSLRLLSTADGGRAHAIRTDHRAPWNIGNAWRGTPTLNDARVLLDGCAEVPPGGQGRAFVEPLVPELWSRVQRGDVLALHEGSFPVGFATVLEVIDRPAWVVPGVAEFVAEAGEFMDFVQDAGGLPLRERLERAQDLLLRLYSAGTRLPAISGDGPEAEPTWEAPDRSVWPGFEQFELYSEVFDPYVQEAPVMQTLSDDILDVRADIEGGYALWISGPASRAAAVWHWKFHFDVHWGDHAIDALRALHRACRAAAEN